MHVKPQLYPSQGLKWERQGLLSKEILFIYIWSLSMIRKAIKASLRNRCLPTFFFFNALINFLFNHSLNELCPLEIYPTRWGKVAQRRIRRVIVTRPYPPSAPLPKAAISLQGLVVLPVTPEQQPKRQTAQRSPACSRHRQPRRDPLPSGSGCFLCCLE